MIRKHQEVNMKLLIGFIFLNLLTLQVDFSTAQGAAWTKEETEIIAQKILWTERIRSQVQGSQELVTANLLRLGFHDCMPYVNPEGALVNGCDGCLDPTEIETQGQTHMGLKPIANHLQKIFEDPNYPKKSPKLSVSMKDSGKSRADLWAFATLLGALGGMAVNNRQCEAEDGCVLLKGTSDCRVEWQSPKFQTGRKDCSNPDDPEEPWHAAQKEVRPDAMGNGPKTVGYYKDNFGLTAREAIALQQGAHSLGDFRAKTSGFVYQWTKFFTEQLNNQQLKHISNQPIYFANCKSMKTGPKGTYLIGNSTGQPAESRWEIRWWKPDDRWQWKLLQDRCPGWVTSSNFAGNNDCSVINDDSSPDPTKADKHAEDNAKCCTDLEPGIFCQPECQKPFFSDQTSLGCDVGMYYHFETEENGKPFGCKGMDKDDYNIVDVWCEKEEYAPEGEPLYQIVEDLAESNVNMMKDFAPALEKMILNGYQTELTTLTEVPSEWYMHVIGL